MDYNSVRADPTSLENLSAGRTFGAFRVGASLLNAFDAKDAGIQYFYGSRLPGEPLGNRLQPLDAPGQPGDPALGVADGADGRRHQ